MLTLFFFSLNSIMTVHICYFIINLNTFLDLWFPVVVVPFDEVFLTVRHSSSLVWLFRHVLDETLASHNILLRFFLFASVWMGPQWCKHEVWRGRMKSKIALSLLTNKHRKSKGEQFRINLEKSIRIFHAANLHRTRTFAKFIDGLLLELTGHACQDWMCI